MEQCGDFHYSDVLAERLPNLLAVLNSLLCARKYALNTQEGEWQFAVEVGELRDSGASNSDLRWLLHERFVEHAYEQSTSADTKRCFTKAKTPHLKKSSCFIITDKGAAFVQRANFSNGKSLPKWSEENRQLKVDNLVVKNFRCPARNQETILSAFQEEGWPARIDDPLPPLDGQDPKRRLHDAIRSLNRNQVNHLVRFRGDGTGEGVVWEFHRKTTPNDPIAAT